MKAHQSLRRDNKRNGMVIAFVALAMLAIMSVVALAVDGGMLINRRRDAQTTADAAAMAAACVLYSEYPTNQGTDSNNNARAAAQIVARENGYSGTDGVTTVTVNIPPSSGPYAGKASYAEVIVTYSQPHFFSRLFGFSNTQIGARAVARGAWTAGSMGVLVLDYTGRAALNAQGNGAFTETGGDVIVNSNHDEAVVDGGNGKMVAEKFFITGNAKVNGGGQLETAPIPNQVFVGVHPTPDPLAYLPTPSVPPNGTISSTSLGGGKKRYTLTPGRFTNLPVFNSGDEVVLKQASDNANGGIYYIDGGGFKSTGAKVSMDPNTTGGVMIYNNPQSNAQSEKLQITGNSSGSVQLSPLTEGQYKGMMLWQNRTSTNTVEIEGNGDFKIKGSFYFANALLKVSGNGGTFAADDGTIVQGSHIGSQFIVKDLSVSGNGNVHLNYKSSQSTPHRILSLVE